MPRNISVRDAFGVDITMVLIVGVGEEERSLLRRGTRSFGNTGMSLALIRDSGPRGGEEGSSMGRREYVYSMICV
jgi:hypothetical protein